MTEGGQPRWLQWIKRLQAIAQDGLTYSQDDYDLGRYEQLRKLASEMLAANSTGTLEEARDLLALETGPATPSQVRRSAPEWARDVLVGVRAGRIVDGKLRVRIGKVRSNWTCYGEVACQDRLDAGPSQRG